MEKSPENRAKPSNLEKKPVQTTDVKRKLGETAIKGATKK
jgi:hypothetical protein